MPLTKPKPILAATRWKDNGYLIGDCVKLGYLRYHDHILDPTYGDGIWWKQWLPEKLYTNNINDGGFDFTDVPIGDETFDAITYDPPYVSVGGRKTSTIKDFHRAYGMHDAPDTPQALQELINAGLTEMHRLVKPAATKKMQPVKPNGIVLVKCQDYVSSGSLWPGTFHTLEHAFSLGFTLFDKFEHIGNARAQPERRRKDGTKSRQQHARRNLSTMYVLRKGRR